jgi:hypothetical protein
MDVGRRHLLAAAALGVVTAPLLPADGAVAAGATRTTSAMGATNPYSRSRFTPRVGSRFTLTTPTGRWSATLASVADLQPLVVAGDDRRFAVTFCTTSAVPRDGVFTVAARGFADTPVFLTADPARRALTGTVNRL